MDKLINALLFQIGWFICASSVKFDLELPALSLCGLLILIHLIRSKNLTQELSISALVVVLGIGVDSSFQYLQIIDFYGWHTATLSPFWDWMIWLMFALTLESSLVFFKKMNWMRQALAGLVFSPVSYVAGSRLGAASFDASLMHIAAIGVTWMLVFPGIFSLVQWINSEFE